MKHEEFLIGEEFWCGGNQWRCTDIGTRVIVAIKLGTQEIVVATRDDKNPDLLNMRHETTDDPSWFNGPPYAVAEHVFDEDDIVVCSRAPEDQNL
jgi:hypothetical protein